MSKQPSQDELLALFESLQDPVWFAENILGLRLWSGQKTMLRACANNRRVSVRSGHKVSKSFSAAILAIWWASTKVDARVAITSASFHQVQKILWREIRKMKRQSAENIGGHMYRDPAAGFQFPNGNEIFGFSTAEPERAAGISSPNLLYIIDEASGVGPEIFEAMEGNRAAGATIVMFSNPTKTTGDFFESFNTKRRFWKCIHIPSTSSPNITGEMTIPGLATAEWVQEKKEEWGEESPMYQVRVAGNFPGQGSDAVIGLSLVIEARDRYKDASDEGMLRLGVDVARYGDDETVIQPVRGLKAYPPIILMGNMNGVEVAGRVLDVVSKMRRPSDHEVRVKVDEIGIGASPVDFLGIMERSKDLGVITVPVNVSNRADEPDTYYNLRSQMCFDLREWLESGGSIPEDDRLTQEMVSPTFTFDPKGRRKLDAKDKEKKVLGRSPDRRNALELAIHESRGSTRTIGGGMFPM